MKKFFENNKVFVAIIIAAFIIGGFIYLSKPSSSTTSTQKGATLLPTAEKSEKGAKESSFPISSCINLKESGNYVGEYKCVEGKVVNVYISKKGTIFFDFCRNYKTCPFSAVIFKSNAGKFSHPKQYQNKIVRITGLIRTYKSRPEIILNDPSQIKI